MTINLPNDLEHLVREEVQSGRFASMDDVVAEAVRGYLNSRNRTTETPERTTQARQPIWELIEQENSSIPPEVWDTLPTDLSAQHDHYIYGTPKRIEP